jgi:hypothetical protein
MNKFKVGDTVLIKGNERDCTESIDGKVGIIKGCFNDGSYRVKIPKGIGEWFIYEKDLQPYSPKVVEMTIGDIEAILGCQIKIVGER